MQNTTYTNTEPTTGYASSDVAWGAIFGGTLAAIAISIILAPLGVGLGLAAASPWHMAESAKMLTSASAIWLIIVQWISSGLGGYMTGRLRSEWANAHTHEAFFRDTVHGFLTWALATVVGALILMSIGSNLIGHAMQGKHDDGKSAAEMYYTDTLFRSDATTANVTDHDRSEATQLLTMAAANNGHLPDSDERYLTQLVAARTGIPEADAQHRVTDTLTSQQAKINTAAKTSGVIAMFMTLSMLFGAFVATAASALGGHHHDVHYKTGTLHRHTS